MKMKDSAQAAAGLARMGIQTAAQQAAMWLALISSQSCPDTLLNTDFLDTLGQDSAQITLAI